MKTLAQVLSSASAARAAACTSAIGWASTRRWPTPGQ
jgi:hypothetical protein